jgi:predicted DNA-binding transcriptional regulator YafY
LLGQNPAYEGITNLALDRVEGEIVPVSQPYIENIGYDFDEYFEDIVGVTKPVGKKVEKVKLWFSLAQAPYIHTKPLHGTQKEKLDESGLTITIEVIPNVELEQIILRYGENCLVLEPDQLKEKILERLRQSLNNY